MKNYILCTVLAFTLSFAYAHTSLAVCVEGPTDTFTCNTDQPNPDLNGVLEGGVTGLVVNVLPGAAIDTRTESGGGGGDAITTGGDSEVNINGGDVKAQSNGIQVGTGTNNIEVTDSVVFGLTNAAILGAPQVEIINIVNSTVTSERDDGMRLGSGDDIVNVEGSTVGPAPGNSSSDGGIDTDGGNDQVTIKDSFISAFVDSIELDSGNDTLNLGNNAELEGLIECGSGFDTIVFEMDVPEDLLISLTNEIFFANPVGDSIEINGLTYEWIDCELLVAELNGVPLEPRPIPTLSEWGLIATAGVLGLVGLYAVRRRRAAV